MFFASGGMIMGTPNINSPVIIDDKEYNEDQEYEEVCPISYIKKEITLEEAKEKLRLFWIDDYMIKECIDIVLKELDKR